MKFNYAENCVIEMLPMMYNTSDYVLIRLDNETNFIWVYKIQVMPKLMLVTSEGLLFKKGMIFELQSHHYLV